MPMTFGDNGLQIQDLAAIRAEIGTALRTALGLSTLQTDADDDPLGQFLAAVGAEPESLLQELLLDLYLAAYVAEAAGANLDKAVLQVLPSGRKPATSTVVTVQAHNTGGAPVTAPAGSLLELAATGDQYTVQADVTIAAGGTQDLACAAVVKGPQLAPASSSWQWVSAFVGSTDLGLSNSADGTAGSARENDADLRLRFFASRQLAGGGTLGSILAAVLALNEVADDARAYENNTATTGISSPAVIADLPGHAFEVVARGTYTAAEIGAAILSKKPAGTQAYGASSVVVTDSQGFLQTIGYTPAVSQQASIVVNVSGVPDPGDGGTAIKNAIVAAFARVLTTDGTTGIPTQTTPGIGQPVVYTAVLAAVYDLVKSQGCTGVTGTINGVAANLSAAFDHYSLVDQAHITVNFV